VSGWSIVAGNNPAPISCKDFVAVGMQWQYSTRLSWIPFVLTIMVAQPVGPSWNRFDALGQRWP
jgi:hypothetical protein